MQASPSEPSQTTELSVPLPSLDGRHLTFAPASVLPEQAFVWDQLWRGESPGRILLTVRPNPQRLQRLRETYAVYLPEMSEKPPGWTDEWEQALCTGLYALAAQAQLPGDADLALSVPRSVHGQSQGLVDLFGAYAEQQPDGNYFPHPLPADPALVAQVTPSPLQTSRYWEAVEWIRYARAATGGTLPFRNPVMTGPLDTANYLLGSTTLLEWLYTEPETVHRLLDTVTEVLVAMLAAISEAAGGALRPHHGYPSPGGFDLCSEVRSLISTEAYEQFEAPYLRRLGERRGCFGVHSCGSWERTLPSVLRNGYLRVMHGQSKENDLPTLCRLAAGKIALAIGRSADLDTRYLWPDLESFLRHVLAVVPDEQPFVLDLGEDDLPLWLHLYREVRGEQYPLAEPLWAG